MSDDFKCYHKDSVEVVALFTKRETDFKIKLDINDVNEFKLFSKQVQQKSSVTFHTFNSCKKNLTRWKFHETYSCSFSGRKSKLKDFG